VTYKNIVAYTVTNLVDEHLGLERITKKPLFKILNPSMSKRKINKINNSINKEIHTKKPLLNVK
jgi:predicted NAD/FAD-binding protein